ncbi:hypothetical protein ACFLZH_03875 [Patescibacteria group bacterium]
MNDVLKQERHKLYMAADNINHMLEILQNRDNERFMWAWQQIQSNVNMAQGCFIDVSKDHCEKIDKLYIDHKKLLDKVREQDPSNFNDAELKALFEEFKTFLDDMSSRFELEEFEE